MTKRFNQYLAEVMGADSMERDPADTILSPDIKNSNAMLTFSGTGSTIPVHWNNSPFLSGGRLTSAFGLNPKEPKKKSVLSYYEFIKATRGFQNK
jgi:hypothetical protein